MAKEAQKLNPQQRRYLQDRLKSLRYAGPSFQEPKKPASVKSAEQIAAAWAKRVSALRSAYEQKRADRHRVAVRAILFGTPQEALAAFDAYEAEVGKE